MNNNSLWSDALYRLTRNRAAMIGGLILVALIICAILAPWIAPYSYSYQDLNLGASPPSSDHLLGTDILGRDLLSRILYGASQGANTAAKISNTNINPPNIAALFLVNLYKASDHRELFFIMHLLILGLAIMQQDLIVN